MTSKASKQTLQISAATLDQASFDTSPESAPIKERLRDLVKAPGSILVVAGPVRSGRTTFMRALAHTIAPQRQHEGLPFEVGIPNGQAVFVRCDTAADLQQAVAAASERTNSIVVAVHSQTDIDCARRRLEALSIGFSPQVASALRKHYAGVVLCANMGDHFAYTFFDEAEQR